MGLLGKPTILGNPQPPPFHPISRSGPIRAFGTLKSCTAEGHGPPGAGPLALAAAGGGAWKVGDPMVRRRHWSPDPKRNTKKNRWFPIVFGNKLINFSTFFCGVHWVQKQFCFKGLHKIREQNRRKRSFSVSWPGRVWNLWTFKGKKKSSQTFSRNLKWLDMSGKTLESICTNVSPGWTDWFPMKQWSLTSHVSMNPGALPAFWGPWTNSKF